MPAFWQTSFDQRISLGQFLKEGGKLEDASREYRDAAPLVSNLPIDIQVRFRRWVGLAIIQVDLGLLLATNGKNQESETAYAEVLAIRDKLEKEFASKAEIRRDLAASQVDTCSGASRGRRTPTR